MEVIKISSADTTPKADSLDLQLLGINSDKMPSVGSIPKIFNPACKDMWEEALDSSAYDAVKVSKPTTQYLWTTALRIFLAQCREKKVAPFANPTSDVANNKFKIRLDSARSAVAKFFNSNKLANVFTIKSVSKTITFLHGSTIINVKATCNNLNDPTLEKLLLDIGFKRLSKSWHLSLQANIDIKLTEVNAKKTIIEYTISVNPGIVYQSKTDTRLPSKTKLSEFVVRNYLAPAIKRYPIKNLSKAF